MPNPMSPTHSREARQQWQPIETAPVTREMFVAKAFNVQPTGKRFLYTSDPYCVWSDQPGVFERWPHPFAPTHWLAIPPFDLTGGVEAKPCARCGGTGVVDDGEIGFYEGTGIPYENGPIKCVKDCPVCK